MRLNCELIQEYILNIIHENRNNCLKCKRLQNKIKNTKIAVRHKVRCERLDKRSFTSEST